MKKRSIIAVVLLSVITCGIYSIYWMYQTRTELKAYLQDESISPALEVFLCIICFPYSYYWFYKYSKDMVRAELQAGLPMQTDNSIINLVLCIFGLGLVSMLIIQAQLNEIAEK